MDLKPNPFSLYDFLGYFTPGAILIYSVLLGVGYADPESTAVGKLSEYFTFDKPEIYIPFIIVSYTLGHLLSFISSSTIERYSVWAIGYPSKYLLGIKHDGYFAVKEHRFVRGVLRGLTAILLLPVSFPDFIFGYFLSFRKVYAKQLDPLLIALLRAKTESLINRKAELLNPGDFGEASDQDYFRYVYHYALENAPHHGPKMQNYVALYGFLRTITLLTIVLAWIELWYIYSSPSVTSSLWLAAIGISLTSYVFYLSFVKYYRRFSLEALMAMSVTYHSKA